MTEADRLLFATELDLPLIHAKQWMPMAGKIAGLALVLCFILRQLDPRRDGAEALRANGVPGVE